VDPLSRPLTRRQLVRYTASGLALAGLGPILAACGGGEESATGGGGATTGTAAGGGGKLKMWWWGDQEAVGVKAWVDDTIAKFKTESGYTINPLLMSTDNVIPQFTNAAAAGKPPDIQFLFNGIYHMENVWHGYLTPLDDLVSAGILSKSGETVLSHYDGKQYRVGFYIVGFGLEYNKDMFDKAGLNADSPPKTWDAFLDACDKLKSSGVTPIAGGVKDGFFGEWYFVNTLTQNLNSPADALNLFIGNLDWRDPKYHEHWVKLQELKDKGFINDDINSLSLYQGIQLVETEKAAMCINTTAALPNAEKALGDALGYFIMPTFGTGKMAGIPITDTQGFGIPTKAGDQDGAAKFLEFMHSQDRVNAMWTTSKALPADEKFDSSLIDDAFLKQVYDKWWAGKHNVYVADLMPTLFWTDAMFVASQKILSGNLTGEQSGDLAHDVTEKWKKQNPDLVENYTKWGADLKVA
jgi:raffinose/stachyose/melibiose transport system substrate-binding protein